MDNNTYDLPISKAELARLLNVSRTYVTLLTQGKRKPSPAMIDKLTKLGINANLKYMYQRMYGPLAQLAEQLTLNQQVPSSILGRLSSQLIPVHAFPYPDRSKINAVIIFCTTELYFETLTEFLVITLGRQ